jgi:hypothetical protein
MSLNSLMRWIKPQEQILQAACDLLPDQAASSPISVVMFALGLRSYTDAKDDDDRSQQPQVQS